MKNVITLAVLISSSLSLACPVSLDAQNISAKKTPKSNLALPNIMTSSTVTLAEYNSTFDKVRGIYTPIFSAAGFELLLESDWSDESLQAYSTAKVKNPHRRKVYVSGGYARKNLMSKETLLVTICHEIGHHLGGYPKMTGQSWPASAEGQADYYATAKCMKLILQDEAPMNEEIANTAIVPEFVKDECSKQYTNKEDQNLCLRLAVASEKQAKTVISEVIESFINLDNMDTSSTHSMNLGYPAAKCRMTTLYQGALCNVNPSTKLNDSDETTGACHSKNGHQLGARPLCWFLPKE